MRYPLIDGQGILVPSMAMPGAMRYTEVRMAAWP